MIVKDILDYDNSDEWREILSLCVSTLFTTSLFNCYRLDNLNDIFPKGLLDGIGGVGLTYLYANGDVKNNILSFEIWWELRLFFWNKIISLKNFSVVLVI